MRKFVVRTKEYGKIERRQLFPCFVTLLNEYMCNGERLGTEAVYFTT